MKKILEKLFKVKSISEAVFIIMIGIMVATFIIINYISFHKRYIHFTFENTWKDEVFFSKIGEKTLFVYKTINKQANRPTIYYKVKRGDVYLYGGAITIGEFELFPEGVIFEDANDTLTFIDQYALPSSSPLNKM